MLKSVNENNKVFNSFIAKTIINIYEMKNGKLTEEKKLELKENYSFIVRKAAHFTIYLILGLLVSIVLTQKCLNLKQIIIYTVLICMAYAVTDEIHQLVVSGRAGMFTDVLLDSAGVVAGVLLMSLLIRIGRMIMDGHT